MDAPVRGSSPKPMCESTILGEPCPEVSTRKGFCELHYGRDYSGQPMDAPIRTRVLGCKGTVQGEPWHRPHEAHGYCPMHYARMKDGRDMDGSVGGGFPDHCAATIEGAPCPRPEVTMGSCDLHYTRRRNGWDMDAPVLQDISDHCLETIEGKPATGPTTGRDGVRCTTTVLDVVRIWMLPCCSASEMTALGPSRDNRALEHPRRSTTALCITGDSSQVVTWMPHQNHGNPSPISASQPSLASRATASQSCPRASAPCTTPEIGRVRTWTRQSRTRVRQSHVRPQFLANHAGLMRQRVGCAECTTAESG
jgi:hypothetical protein